MSNLIGAVLTLLIGAIALYMVPRVWPLKLSAPIEIVTPNPQAQLNP